ncbi:MAG: UDP-N-acetylmuramoyl-tripeptide--D-alanyl-D-alanine ligase, partial [Acidobacteria bacterium]
ASAKRELIENLKQPGTAVLNYDDPRVRRFAEGFGGRVVTFGFEEGAEYRAIGCRAHNYQVGPEIGTRFLVKGPAHEGDFYLPLPGRHNVENALAAIATASRFEVPWERIFAALWNFKPLSQRTEIVTLPLDV